MFQKEKKKMEEWWNRDHNNKKEKESKTTTTVLWWELDGAVALKGAMAEIVNETPKFVDTMSISPDFIRFVNHHPSFKHVLWVSRNTFKPSFKLVKQFILEVVPQAF